MLVWKLISFKNIFLVTYSYSILYTHFRGKVRLKYLKQLFDHSSLMAPINLVMYLFSAVPKTPFLSLDNFPELKPLQNNWQIIRDEAANLYQQGYIAGSDNYDDIGFNSFFRRGWKRFYLKWYQRQLPSAQLCPKTLALVHSIPSINAAMFALLPKHSFLFPHRDPYAGSLRYHLGLITPNSAACCIYVDSNEYIWHDGEAVIFDETFVHKAKNETDIDRIILFCDIKRPLTNSLANKFNQLISFIIMRSSSSKNLPGEKVGLINQIFKYLYNIRLIFKKLKQYNHLLYYALKYLGFGFIFYWFFFKR